MTYDTASLQAEIARLHQDIGRLIQSQKAQQRRDATYYSLYMAMTEGVALHELVCSEAGTPIDYRILDVNPAYETITGIERAAAIGQLASTLYGTDEPPYLAIYVNVVNHGQTARFETTFAPMEKTLSIVAFSPCAGQFATVFSDITRQHQTEAQRAHSHALMQAAVESATGGVVVTTPDARIIVCNQRFLDIWHLPANWMHLPTIEAQLQPMLKQTSEPEPFRQRFHALLQQPDGESYDIIRLRDGRILERYSAPYRVEDIPTGRLWSYRDVTEREKTKAEHHKNLSHLRAIFANAAVGITVIDLEGYYLDCNDYWADMIGYSHAELWQRTSLAVTHPDDQPQHHAMLHTLTTGQQDSYQIEQRFVRRDGSIFWGEVFTRPIHSQHNTPESLVSIILDTTGRKDMEARLRTWNEYQTTLHETALTLMNRLDVTRILTDIVTRAARLVGTPHGYIYLLTPDQQQIEMQVGIGLYQQHIGFRLGYGEGLSGKVWQTGEPITVHNYDTWTGRSARLGSDIFHTVLGIPLTSSSGIIGVIGLSNLEQGRVFGDEEVEMLRRFAQLAAIALDNARLFAAARDEIDERRHAEERLHIFYALADNAPDGVAVVDLNLTVIYANPSLRQQTGYGDELIGMPIQSIYDEPGKTLAELYDEILTRGFWESTITCKRKDGSTFAVRVAGFAVRDTNGNIVALAALARDITARLDMEAALRASEERYRVISELVSDYAYAARVEPDHSIHIEWATDALTTVTGFTLAEIEARGGMDSIIYTADLPIVQQRQQRLLSGKQDVSEFRIVTNQGIVRWLRSHARPVWDRAQQRVIRIYSAAQDITAYKVQEAQIKRLAFTDPLTGLPNRRYLYEMGAAALATASSEQDHNLALLYLDLDRFKHVNDNLGHDAGDDLLVQVAVRLHATMRTDDTLARLGGDEFAVLLPNCSPEEARTVAQRMLDALAEPFDLQGHIVHLGGSIGIALLAGAGNSFSHLLTQADIAMYRAKVMGNGIQLYDPILSPPQTDRLQLESDLHRALAASELCLFYQPVQYLPSGQIIGAEALIRWQHPVRGLLLPDMFLPLAEELGLLGILDRWVLKHALHQAAQWYHAGHALDVALNLTAHSLQDPDLLFEVEDLLALYNLPAERVIIEITERSALRDMATTRHVLTGLRKLGIRMALDDFGTGYASLTYLRQLPVDVLKLDRSFVMGIGQNRQDEAVVRALLELAHGLELMVVAEGVETGTQQEWLLQARCSYAQGYLIGHPMKAEDLCQHEPHIRVVAPH